MAIAWALAAPACGYQAVYVRVPDEARLHVHLARAAVGSALAADEVVSGVRDELSRNGALSPGDGYPRVEVEVLNEGETSEGIAAVAGTPVARATQVSLVGRAWIEASPGAAPSRDTGDVDAEDAVASGAPVLGLPSGGSAAPFQASREVFLHDEATLALGRRLGIRLAQHLLAAPGVVGEGTGRER